MVPDAVLQAFIEVRNAREATREVRKVQEQLKEATKVANVATGAVARFGKMRGTAIIRVDAKQATDALKENGQALDANGTAARRMSSEVAATTATFTRAAGATRAASAATGEHAVMLLRAERAEHAVAAAKTAGVAADVNRRVAVQALTAAQGRYDDTMRSSVATDSQKQAASLALERAQVRLERSTQAVAAADIRARQAAMGHASALHDLGAASRAAGGGGRDGGNGMRWFVASFGDLPGRIFLSTRLLGALMNIMITMAPVLAGVAAQLVAVVAAMGPLIGLAAGVGGAMVAAAQGFGVFKLATMGVGDALKEQIKNQSRAGTTALSNASAQRSAAQAIQSAQEGVRTAVKAVADAERDHREAVTALGPAYTTARRSLADMRAEAQTSVLSIARMSLGLQDARKALNDLINGPSPLDMADAQDRVADATRGIDRAMLNLTDAQNAYNKAASDPEATAHDIAKARQSLRDAENAVGDARREATRAAEALAELEKPANSRDLAAARLSVREAEAALGEARRNAHRQQSDLNAAEAAGIAGSREVVAARSAITSAEERLREARLAVGRANESVRNAQAAANESMQRAALAATNLNEKMSDLPAPAQAFVRQLEAMKPRLDVLRQTAAAGFFPGATAGLQAAMGSFSSVNKVVGQTSTVLGEAARKSGELVGSSAFGRDIEIIGGRNARVIDTFGQALRHVISALRHVLVAAGPLTQWLADVANKWALSAAASAKAGRETGRTAEFFEKAKATAQLLGSILHNLGSAFLGIGKASAESGRAMLHSLDRLTERFAAWANSVRGRNDIAEFMESARRAMASLSPAFGALASAFTAFAMNVLPVYATVLRLLEPIMSELVTTFLLWKVAATGAAIATTLLKGAMAVAAFVTGGWATAFWALNAAMRANPVMLIVLALAALVAALVLAYKNSETFRNIVNAVGGALKSAAVAVWNFVTDIEAMPGKLLDAGKWIVEKIVEGVKLLPGALWEAAKWLLGQAWEAIKMSAEGWGLIGQWAIGKVVEGLKALPGLISDFAGWLKDKLVLGVKVYAEAIKQLGSWVLGKIVEGLKTIGEALASFGGWLKNRVVEGVHAAAGAFKSLGSWVLNRIVAGLKVVGEALASVGGWLKNRIVENVHLAAEAFKSLGSWALNRIVDGFRTVTEALGSAGGWLKNRLVEAFGSVKDGFMSIGGSVMGWIVDGLKKGANKLIGFLNKILSLIEEIPGIKDGSLGRIEEFKIDKNARGGIFARSGGVPGATQAFAHGGAFARTGGIASSPITLVGEEAPLHKEFVIPTNPAYRSRAQGLLAQAAGEIGFAEGGVIEGFRRAIKATGASDKPQLALWMAGIVESGLRNLPYGDRDSVGALQQRPSQGWTGLMNPFRAAIEFLQRAIPLAGSVGSAGQLAQAVQRSAYPDKYDAVREEAMKYFKGGGGGGILSAIGGAISSVGGVLGELLSKGAGFILDKLPGVGDLPDWLKGTGKYVLEKAGDWIKEKVAGLVSAATASGGGGGDVNGLQPQIKAALAFARSHGWRGQVNSGFRSRAEQQRLYDLYRSGRGNLAAPPGNSMHERGLAVDVSDAEAFARAMEAMGAGRLYRRVPGEPWHFSTTGYAKGGVYGPYMAAMSQRLREGGQYGVLGSYRNGTDYVPRTGPYELHRGESVTPAGRPTELRIDSLHVYVGDREITDIARVEVEQAGERFHAELRAGVF